MKNKKRVTVWAVFNYDFFVVEYGTREAMQTIFNNGDYCAIASKRVYIRQGETLADAMKRHMKL